MFNHNGSASCYLVHINKYFLMDKNVNKGFSTEFDLVGLCENTHKTSPESSLGKATFSGKIQNGRH